MLRLHLPLIEPDLQIYRIRLSGRKRGQGTLPLLRDDVWERKKTPHNVPCPLFRPEAVEAGAVQEARLQAALGEQVEANAEQQRSTVRGFKIAQAELRRQLHAAEQRVERLRRRRQKEPKRIAASDQRQLPKEKKLVVDALKMVAYQVETELLGMLQGGGTPERRPRAAPSCRRHFNPRPK